jgi:hypothetical protein
VPVLSFILAALQLQKEKKLKRNSSTMDAGSIVGIVLGSLFALLLFVLLAKVYLNNDAASKRRTRKQQRQKSHLDIFLEPSQALRLG